MGTVLHTPPSADRSGPSSLWRFVGPLLAPAALLLAMACSGGGGGGTPVSTEKAPAITTQPASQTINAGSPVSFTAAASGTPTPTFTWERSNDGGTTWTAISSATSDTYTFTTVKADNNAQFHAIATNTVSPAATSSAATLTVHWLSVTTQPANQSVTTGHTATFSVAPDANPAPTYQWQRSTDSGSTWADVATGGTAATYTTATTILGDNGSQYRCVLTNTSGSVNSDAATLIVTASGPTSDTLTVTIQTNGGPNGDVTVTGPASYSHHLTTSQTLTGLVDGTYTITAAAVNDGATPGLGRENGGNLGATYLQHYPAVPVQAVTLSLSGTYTATVTVNYPVPVLPVTVAGEVIDFVLVPAGTYTMGETETTVGSYPVALSAHTVTIGKAFYVAKYLCTQAQWLAITGSNPSSFDAADVAPNDTPLLRPVENVSYTDITTSYLPLLNLAAATGKPAGSTFRLPTEAEYEYACRAGVGNDTNYYFGDYDPAVPADLLVINNHMWSIANSPSAAYVTGITHPVGKKLQNAWGLYDIIGQVWQVCEDDWHATYDVPAAGAVHTRPDDGSAWVDSPRAAERSFRGGSFDLNSQYGQSKFRGPYTAAYKDWNTGFRLVLQLP